MEAILSTILSYLVGLAANLRTDAILTSREELLQRQLEQHDALSKAIAASRHAYYRSANYKCLEISRNIRSRSARTL